MRAIKLLCLLVTISLFAACNKETTYPEVKETSTHKYIVASQKMYAQTADPCTGTTLTMLAYVVKQDTGDKWTPFFAQVKGFKYTEGVEYVIEVRKQRLYDPRRSVEYWDEYTLTKIISEQKTESAGLPSLNNAPCIDAHIDGNNLSRSEVAELRAAIIHDAFSSVEFYYGAPKLKLGYYNWDTEATSAQTYDYLRSPSEQDMTVEQKESIAWTQDLPIKAWYLLTSTDQTTALYLTSNYATKSSSAVMFAHLDVTAKYKTKYPNLLRAYSVHKVQM